jgi:hypothetical protein
LTEVATVSDKPQCHWWDAERGCWVVGRVWIKRFMGLGSLLTADLLEKGRCPYCGADLPEGGQEVNDETREG